MAGLLFCKIYPSLCQNHAYIEDTFIALAILLLSITWLFLVKQSAFKTWGTSQSYFVGICHGFAAVCVLLLVYNVVYFEIQHVTTSTEGSIAFIYVTANGSYICPRNDQGDVTGTRMEIWLVFLASYTLCLILCNAVVNSKLDARHEVWPQVRMQGVLKEGLPTDQVIAELAHYLMKSEIWKRVGRALGIGEPHITQIHEDESYAYERAYRMFTKWRQLMGAGATYEALADALKCEHVGRPDLAQQFCYSVEVAQGVGNADDGAAA